MTLQFKTKKKIENRFPPILKLYIMNFLTAEWRKLAIINYEVDPSILEKYVPKGVELDFWENKCHVSVIGFMFLNTKLLGIPVPFHRNFEEVNLRFYVKKFENNEWKRGVVFIKEIVPKIALKLVANIIYNEHYEKLPMKNAIKVVGNKLNITYSWKTKKWNNISIEANNSQLLMKENSEFEFITEHYFGYTKNKNSTSEYEVQHPKWKHYHINNYEISLDFKENYGDDFEFLNAVNPCSVMLAEGSEVKVKTKNNLG